FVETHVDRRILNTAACIYTPTDAPGSLHFVAISLLGAPPKDSRYLGADIFTFTGLLGEGHAEPRFQAAPGSGLTPGTEVELNGKGTTAGVNVRFLCYPRGAQSGHPR